MAPEGLPMAIVVSLLALFLIGVTGNISPDSCENRA